MNKQTSYKFYFTNLIFTPVLLQYVNEYKLML